MNNGPEIQAILRRAAAMTEARCGQLVVYRDWAEFAKSAVWVIALPLGVSWMFEHQSDFLSRCAGLAFVVTGAMSVRLMVAGAFKYNSGSFCWLSLFWRIRDVEGDAGIDHPLCSGACFAECGRKAQHGSGAFALRLLDNRYDAVHYASCGVSCQRNGGISPRVCLGLI